MELERLVQRMSQRLILDAELLKDNATDSGSYRCVADVGCDHGYVSMYLVMRDIALSAIAMDIRKGPLSAAESNVSEFGLKDSIEIRLSDGLAALSPGEADALVIAGMGGRLMTDILTAGDVRKLDIKRGVLQPQSDLPFFRRFLRNKGYGVLDERIICEDGKYYFPMLVDFFSPGDYPERVRELSDMISGRIQSDDEPCDTAIRLSDRYGVFNILRHSELLISYLRHGIEVGRSILSGLDRSQHPERYLEVELELSDMELILNL